MQLYNNNNNNNSEESSNFSPEVKQFAKNLTILSILQKLFFHFKTLTFHFLKKSLKSRVDIMELN